MNNLFDSDNYPNEEPSDFVVGARWAWKRSEITEAYPTASYTLKYVFAHQSQVGSFTITASKVSSAHVVEVPIATTTTYKAGDYLWKAVIVRDSDSEEVVVDEGYAELKRQSGEVSSHVYTTLKNIRATIEGKASKDQLSYTINGRSLTRYSFEELMKLEKEYLARWNREKAALDRKAGRESKHQVLVKMGA